MNILEHYIVEVHSVKPFTAEWTKEFPDREFVEVDHTIDCYGKSRNTRIYSTDEWKGTLERGYYMG